MGPDGYVRIANPDRVAPRDAPYSERYLLEHRWVMEQVLGRQLDASEQVHHKNGDRADNRPENLEVLTLSEHQRRHWAMDKEAKSRQLQEARRMAKLRRDSAPSAVPPKPGR